MSWTGCATATSSTRIPAIPWTTACLGDRGLPDATLADALSTALFVMGRDGAAQYWRGREDFEFVLMGEDGSIAISEGLEGSFSLAGEQGSVSLEVIRR